MFLGEKVFGFQQEQLQINNSIFQVQFINIAIPVVA